jgi:glycosyltransferase involved in cell wall biosynthesis
MDSSPTQSPPARRKVLLLGSAAQSLTNFRGPLIAAMVQRGHQVFAAAPEIDPDTAAKLVALGATPVPVVLGRASIDPLKTWRSGRKLRALVKSIAPDVMIAYTIKPVVLGAAAARAAQVPVFAAMITGLGYAFLGGLNPKRVAIRLIAMLMYRRALAASGIVIFQNEDDRSDFRRMRLLPGSKPTIVVNGSGVDLDHFEARPVPAGTSFLMVARFLRDKGIREYGAAAARLKAEFPEVRIRLAGQLDGADSISPAELDSMVASGVENLGLLADVRPAIADSSVYVLPSYREGTPRTVLEAMAVGRAVITTDAPGCRNTVDEGENGLLVPVRDSDALYAAMRRFVVEPDLAEKMGAASLRLVREKYDVHKVNSSILEATGL